ncbi:DUF3084 domain-containing protein [Geochorda subterranea]|uniref:DUF3084 domain-containing protein n=1 Tax=Geochorda subterranea TaxID=3109564 RepID=A0ABZ1BQM4_9FIRM|nr:DUF3084 domain-containing protein [Limnochorda sp. LNt]WRP14868.1 DUF3084 domain-containing protein [Limnochorda sp. LNt]
MAFIGALLVMAGLIAFIGDRVGMRVGRRRLTLLGLRPRHTSVVITVLTGVVIAGLSLGMLVAASNEVRLALFRIDEIHAVLADNRRQLEALQQELDRRQRALAEATAARDEAEAQRDAAMQERARAESELKQAQSLLDQVQGELASARQELARTQQRLEKTRQDLTFQVARVQQLQELGETLAARVQDLEQQVASLRRTEQELSDAIIALWGTAQRLHYGSLVYRHGEIVLSEVITSDGTAEGARESLLAFLRRVESVASARMGQAQGGEGAQGSVVRLRPDEFDESLATLAGGKGTWVVRARVDGNTLAGEAVVVQIELIPRGLAYQAGQVVAEVVVDPSRERVEDQVLALLGRTNELAIAYGGMVTGPDGTVGKLVSAEEFVRVVEELRQMGRPARVVARAERDTYNTEGPLSIRLDVEALSDASQAGKRGSPGSG